MLEGAGTVVSQIHDIILSNKITLILTRSLRANPSRCNIKNGYKIDFERSIFVFSILDWNYPRSMNI